MLLIDPRLTLHHLGLHSIDFTSLRLPWHHLVSSANGAQDLKEYPILSLEQDSLLPDGHAAFIPKVIQSPQHPAIKYQRCSRPQTSNPSPEWACSPSPHQLGMRLAASILQYKYIILKSSSTLIETGCAVEDLHEEVYDQDRCIKSSSLLLTISGSLAQQPWGNIRDIGLCTKLDMPVFKPFTESILMPHVKVVGPILHPDNVDMHLKNQGPFK
ncbi:hypothetical protein J3A83DRAFT_4185295 [Scleroderma citrinum]